MYGIPSLMQLPPEWAPTGFIAVVTALDENGQDTWMVTASEGMTPDRALGLFQVGVLAQEKAIREILAQAHGHEDNKSD